MTIRQASVHLVNALTEDEVTELYQKELRKSIRKGTCCLTHRKLSKGEYARVQIPKSVVLKWPTTHPVLDEMGKTDLNNWEIAKSKFRVMIHHLAYRHANHFQQIPLNVDVMHLCGRGKAAFKNDPETTFWIL